MISQEKGDALVGNILGDNLMDATARLIGIAVAAGAVLGLIFWLV